MPPGISKTFIQPQATFLGTAGRSEKFRKQERKGAFPNFLFFFQQKMSLHFVEHWCFLKKRRHNLRTVGIGKIVLKESDRDHETLFFFYLIMMKENERRDK